MSVAILLWNVSASFPMPPLVEKTRGGGEGTYLSLDDPVVVSSLLLRLVLLEYFINRTTIRHYCFYFHHGKPKFLGTYGTSETAS